MSWLREAWVQLFTWAPPSVRVAAALVVGVAFLVKGAPKVVGLVGLLLRRGSEPAMAVLTYPEYVLTSLFRRMSWPLLPGTYAYGRLLGAVAVAVGALGSMLERLLDKKWRFPWKTLAAVAAVLVVAWYSVDGMPVGGPRSALSTLNADVAKVDYWISTGRWAPAPEVQLICPPGTGVAPTPRPSTTTKKPAKKSTTKKAGQG